MEISGKTILLGLIGSPVAHSESPAMYNYSFQKLGLDYRYLAFDVPKDNVKEAITAMRVLHMRGMNVTMPDKAEVVKYMDELSPAARITGAVNTIVNERGRLHGYITDGEGFVQNLREHGVKVAGKKVLVAGGGGAATAIQAQCALEGVRELVVFRRTRDHARQIQEACPNCQIRVCSLADLDVMKREMKEADVFVNATSVGMNPLEEESVVPERSFFHAGLVVADAVYHPKQTRLLREAAEAGCQTIDGQGMLLWQGAAAFQLYTGLQMPVKEVKERFFQS